MAELSDTIKSDAGKFKKAASGDESYERHSLSEQIEADRYLASRGAAKAKRFGLRSMVGKTPSALGD